MGNRGLASYAKAGHYRVGQNTVDFKDKSPIIH